MKNKEIILEKNEEYEITIEDMGNDGEGIGHIKGIAVFVKGAAIGDTCVVKIIKVKKNYAYARLMKIITPSPDRVEEPCVNARACGGCTLMHLSYDAQLKWKQKKVENCLKRIGGVENVEEIMEDIVGCTADLGLRYRNKAQFPVGYGKDGEVKIGFYAGHSHNIIDTKECLISDERIDLVVAKVRDFIEDYDISLYDEEKHTGLLRHIVVRVGKKTGEIMVSLVINGSELTTERGGKTINVEADFVSAIKDIEGVKSIILNINKNKGNKILGDEIRLLWGEEKIIDYIGGVKFEIGLLSFYQVNPYQTENMYKKALEYADLSGGETVWDLYCGIGTISLFLAQKAGKVMGVEIVKEAIDDARRNSEINNIDNVVFFVGKAEEVLPQQYDKTGIKADVIVVDPPRKGCDKVAIDTMLRMAPQKIVYVSCDPATLARDIALLKEGGYTLVKACVFDNFCMSTHCETIALIERIKNAKDFVQIGIDAEEYYKIKDEDN